MPLAQETWATALLPFETVGGGDFLKNFNLETVLSRLTSQKMSDYERQTKTNIQGIVAPIP